MPNPYVLHMFADLLYDHINVLTKLCKFTGHAPI